MGRKWSDERHFQVAIKRMEMIKSGKAKTRFFSGPVAKFRIRNTVYYFSVGFKRIELSAYVKNRLLFRKSIRGKGLEQFLEEITDWLRFPNGYVIYKKGKKQG